MNGGASSDRPERAPRWLERRASLSPDRVAIIDPDVGKEYTYRELHERSMAIAETLRKRGVRRGDRVVLLAQNGVGVLDLLFGCGRIGAILVPLNWRLAERELSVLMGDAEPVLVVAEPEFIDVAGRTASGVTCIVLGDELLSSTVPSNETPDTAVGIDDPWLILYTGGTTGVPKGAVLTHGSVLWNAINTNVSWNLSEMDVAPSFTPMFHTGGLNVFTLPLLLLGASVILPRRFDPAQALHILRDRRVTVTFMVPTMFALVAEQPEFGEADLSHLRWAISGGAPLPREIAEQWKSHVPLFKQGYGLTEVGPNNFATSDEDARRGMDHTVGKLTVFAQARIVDADGTDVPLGEVGELLLAGPHMCGGYWRRPEATADAIRDGWFHTGDLARRDEEGFYRIVDRKKDMIITGGENVYPTEVEAVLYAHPAVREVAVVGTPDARWGEAVMAVVSLRDGTTVSVEELRDFCRANLARYKVPKRVEIVTDLPKSGAGKILRAEVKKFIQ